MTSDAEATHDWSGMSTWMSESLTDQAVGFVFDLGPRDYGPVEERAGIAAVCAQIQVLRDDVLILRRSRSVLRRLVIGDYDVDDLPIEEWLDGRHFGDCTDGYFFSRDIDLIADATTAWFRDCGLYASPELIGCEFDHPDSLVPDSD
ncbi:hypothetical protein [Williamsia sp. M5A3_1d]